MPPPIPRLRPRTAAIIGAAALLVVLAAACRPKVDPVGALPDGPSSSAPVPEVEELTQLVPVYKAWVEETLERWALLQKRPRPPAPGAVERTQEAFRRGECEDVAALLARTKDGGPLVKG